MGYIPYTAMGYLMSKTQTLDQSAATQSCRFYKGSHQN